MEPVTGWRKASYSGTNGGNCVEAGNTGHGVAVRHSKDAEGPRLTIPAAGWRVFVSRAERDR